MKVKDVPQDLQYYKGTVVRDLDYAVDENGRYQPVVSDGWEPKTMALNLHLDAIDEDCRKVLDRVRRGETSPLEYHCVKGLMTVSLLSDYTGISKRTIKKHFRPAIFASLDQHTLEVYADALRITMDELIRTPQE